MRICRKVSGGIFQEAGGAVTDITGNEIVFDLSPESFNCNYTIVAAGADLHEPNMKLISGNQIY